MLADEGLFLPAVNLAIDFLLVAHMEIMLGSQYWERFRLSDLPGLCPVLLEMKKAFVKIER
jgi:hypothetical protein